MELRRKLRRRASRPDRPLVSAARRRATRPPGWHRADNHSRGDRRYTTVPPTFASMSSSSLT